MMFAKDMTHQYLHLSVYHLDARLQHITLISRLTFLTKSREVDR
jgi:hypothetical protein